MIIVVTGLPGSGKGVVAKILKRKGFRIVEMGDQVREKMAEDGIAPGGDRIRRYSVVMRKKYGKDIVARMAVEKVAKYVKSKKNIAIVGVRDVPEMKYLKKTLKKLYIVGIVAPVEVRFGRLRDRGRTDDPRSLRKFAERERLEKKGYGVAKRGAAKGIDRLFGMIDYLLCNTDTPVMLARNVNILISKIKRAG
ncbi:MAG: AAA family ATPase [Candidatus Micrarchaeota archaeon]|nr:AAA family ATPase [Candidatus Micrarchaeota archaeon]